MSSFKALLSIGETEGFVGLNPGNIHRFRSFSSLEKTVSSTGAILMTDIARQLISTNDANAAQKKKLSDAEVRKIRQFLSSMPDNIKKSKL